MTTTEAAEPFLTHRHSHDHASRSISFDVEEPHWRHGGIEARWVRVEYRRGAIDGDDTWSSAVVVSGKRLRKDGTPGQRSGSLYWHATGDDSDTSDWPRWAVELAERHHPNRPYDAAGNDLDPGGSYV